MVSVGPTRRTWHGGKYKKTIWLCITASRPKNCPNCKAVTEEALMSAFVESYKLMTRDHKDVLDEFLERVEATLSDNDVLKRIEKEKDKLKDMDKGVHRSKIRLQGTYRIYHIGKERFRLPTMMLLMR